MKMKYFAAWDKSYLSPDELAFIEWAESFFDYEMSGSDLFSINHLIEAFKGGVKAGSKKE